MNEIKGRVINVSNRLPVLIRKYAGGTRLERSSGGLATALEAGWRDQPGVWIGWAGTGPDEAIEPLLVRAAYRRSYSLRSVALTEEDSCKVLFRFCQRNHLASVSRHAFALQFRS